MNCNFNLAFIDLNLHHSRLLLYGPAPNTDPAAHADRIADAGLHLIRLYQNLHRHRSINYTWVAVHNLFTAGTSYLYALYHSPTLRAQSGPDRIAANAHACSEVLAALADRCDAATSCSATFELLAAAVLKLCADEQTRNDDPFDWDSFFSEAAMFADTITPQQDPLNALPSWAHEEPPIIEPSDDAHIFDLINQVPMAAIWDQFFAPGGPGNVLFNQSDL